MSAAPGSFTGSRSVRTFREPRLTARRIAAASSAAAGIRRSSSKAAACHDDTTGCVLQHTKGLLMLPQRRKPHGTPRGINFQHRHSAHTGCYLQLRSFHLEATKATKAMPAAVVVDATSFRGPPKLRDLRLRCVNVPLGLQDGSLEQLTALTALGLRGCGLQRVPDGVASLSPTLCVLDLSDNGRLKVDAAPMAMIPKCSKLRTLALYKSNIREWKGKVDGAVWQGISMHTDREGYVPAQFSSDSLTQLLRLPSSFRKRHNRDLDILTDLVAYNNWVCGMIEVAGME